MNFRFHSFKGYIADLFIAEYSDKILILDCGARTDHSLFVDMIENKLKRRMSDVSLLIVTHIHPDHAGSAKSLSKKYKIPVATPEGINNWYRGIGGKLQHFVDCWFAHLSVFKSGQPFRLVRFPYKINGDYVLNDNMEIPFFNEWRAIHSPGHTAHDIVLYNESRGILYCADSIIKINDKFISPYPVTNITQMKKSLYTLSKLKVNKLVLAHGGIIKVDNMSVVIDEVLRRLSDPLNGTLNTLYPLTRLSHEARNG